MKMNFPQKKPLKIVKNHNKMYTLCSTLHKIVTLICHIIFHIIQSCCFSWDYVQNSEVLQ